MLCTVIKEAGAIKFHSSLTTVHIFIVEQTTIANDVAQNSKRRHPEYVEAFGSVMKKVFEHLAVIKLDEKTVKAIERLCKIWQDRKVFESEIQADISRIWTSKILEAAAGDEDDEPRTPPHPPAKKQRSGI